MPNNKKIVSIKNNILKSLQFTYPYEALQESPFNKGAGSEADWGFLKVCLNSNQQIQKLQQIH